jgi:hypothetical protein
MDKFLSGRWKGTPMINGASNTVSEVDSHCELDLSSYLLVSRKNFLTKSFAFKGISHLSNSNSSHSSVY